MIRPALNCLAGGRVPPVGLKQEWILRWRARFFSVDLGMIEIAPLANVLTPDDDSWVTPVNATATQSAPLNARAVNA